MQRNPATDRQGRQLRRTVRRLGKKSSDVLDSYFWIDKPETEKLSEPLQKIREAAGAAVEEFDKVVRVRRDTNQRTNEVQTAIEALIKSIERSRFESIDDFVSSLAQLREQRGHALGLKELRYVDESIIEQLESDDRRTSGTTESSLRRFLADPRFAGSLHRARAASGRTSRCGRNRRRSQKAGSGNRRQQFTAGIADRNGQQPANRRRDQANRDHRFDRRRVRVAESCPQFTEGACQ